MSGSRHVSRPASSSEHFVSSVELRRRVREKLELESEIQEEIRALKAEGVELEPVIDVPRGAIPDPDDHARVRYHHALALYRYHLKAAELAGLEATRWLAEVWASRSR